MNPETIEQFMARALHHPEKGYYAQNVRAIGSRGDFTTAPQLSQAPAKAIAAWAAKAMRSHRTRNLIEIGPGSGILASQVLKNLPPLSRLRTHLHLVDSSAALSAQQQKLLGKKANYHQTIQSALSACSGKAIIYSNELVDAFPARVFQKTELGWQEIALSHSRKSPQEILLPPAEKPDSSMFSETFQQGQKIEIHESYHRWLTSWLPHLNAGEILTIDYGDNSKNIYHRRPNGTLRAYLHHILLEGPAVFENPGQQDITTDVNFTDLIQWCDPWLTSAPLEKFSNFIRPHLSAEEQHLHTAAKHFTCLIQTTRPQT